MKSITNETAPPTISKSPNDGRKARMLLLVLAELVGQNRRLFFL